MSQQEEPLKNSPHPLLAELCFARPVALDALTQDKILQTVGSTLGSLGAMQYRLLPPKKEVYSTALLLMPDRLEASESGPAALLLRFGVAQTDPSDPAALLSLSQTWQWDEAESIVSASPFRMQVSDVNTLHLPLQQRLTFFQKSLYALVSVLSPQALHFPQSQCFTDPAAYLENKPESPEYFNIYGLVNNRIFTAEEDDCKDVFMDTLGLNLLGLPDLQCFIKSGAIDYADMAYWLYNVADYLRENPNALGDGDALIGLDDAEWVIHYDNALIGPARGVMDIDLFPLEDE